MPFGPSIKPRAFAARPSRRQPFVGDWTLRLHPHELTLREEPPDAWQESSWVIGLDLGQLVDPAALALLRQRKWREGFIGPTEPYTDVVLLQRWPIGYEYPQLVSDVAELAAQLPGVVTVVPDFGGVGAGITPYIRLEMQKRFPDRTVKIRAVTTVGGDRASLKAAGVNERFTVPKLEIITALNVAQQTRIVTGACKHCSTVRLGDTVRIVAGDELYGMKAVVKHLDADTVILHKVESLDPDEEVDGTIDHVRLLTDRGGCSRCRSLRFLDTIDPTMLKQLLTELSTFRPKHTNSSRPQMTVTQGGAGHHGDTALALGLAVWFAGRGQKRLAVWA